MSNIFWDQVYTLGYYFNSLQNSLSQLTLLDKYNKHSWAWPCIKYRCVFELIWEQYSNLFPINRIFSNLKHVMFVMCRYSKNQDSKNFKILYLNLMKHSCVAVRFQWCTLSTPWNKNQFRTVWFIKVSYISFKTKCFLIVEFEIWVVSTNYTSSLIKELLHYTWNEAQWLTEICNKSQSMWNMLV